MISISNKDNFEELDRIICDFWLNEEMDIPVPEFNNTKLSILFKKLDANDIKTYRGIYA